MRKGDNDDLNGYGLLIENMITCAMHDIMKWERASLEQKKAKKVGELHEKDVISAIEFIRSGVAVALYNTAWGTDLKTKQLIRNNYGTKN